MNVNQLYEVIKRSIDNGCGDSLVVIKRGDSSRGPMSVSEVSYVFDGVDWEKGKFVVVPVDPVYSLAIRDEITDLRRQLNHAVLENMRLRRAIQICHEAIEMKEMKL